MKLKVLAIFVAALLVVGALHRPAIAADPNTISVTGTAKIEKKPDIAFITLYIEGNGILMVDAVKQAKDKTESILKAIRENNKQIKNLEVIDIQIGEKKSQIWSSEQKDSPPRPEVIKRIRITIPPDSVLAYQIIDTAIRAGAVMEIPSSMNYPGELNSVVIYGLQNASGIEDEAEKKAMENAREKANKIAALAGKKAGGIVSLGCGSDSFNIKKVYGYGHSDNFPSEHVGIYPDRITISSSANVTFELLDK